MTRKPIGSQWLFNPAIAGYGNVWRPAVATIHHYIMSDEVQPPAKNGAPLPPRRDYTVTLPGGMFLFANEDSLFDKEMTVDGMLAEVKAREPKSEVSPLPPPNLDEKDLMILAAQNEIRALKAALVGAAEVVGIKKENLPEYYREVDLGFPQATGA